MYHFNTLAASCTTDGTFQTLDKLDTGFTLVSYLR